MSKNFRMKFLKYCFALWAKRANELARSQQKKN
nr:MAG TPA: hypothetical protein [Caudoviricetes sp.]